MVQIRKARKTEAVTLALVSESAFHNDIHYGSPGEGGPPGYKSPEWQAERIRFSDYFKIVVDKEIVGGIIVFRKAPRQYELGRIFIHADFQDQGIGTQAFEFLWGEYPLAKRWTLGTPTWNLRNRHFYKKVGFEEIGEDGQGGILFERVIPAGHQWG
jgi:RimJ/RimL family protein N-acetyltransferase